MEVSYDKYSLMVDGKRIFIKSGAFHYFRTPGVEMARDRFLKMKAGGYNTVDIYFNWNYHSPAQGVYDFSGIKDVRKVLQAAKDAGLFVIARPGPFINAEVNAGGLPFWLLKNSIIGAIILYIINFIGIFTIKITFIHCLIVGVFGIPGIVGLLIYLNFIK